MGTRAGRRAVMHAAQAPASEYPHRNPRPGDAVRRTRFGRTRDRGMVTAELAVGILSVALLAGIFCWVVAVIGVQIRCGDSAAQIARQTARGDQAAVQSARAGVPRDAEIDIRSSGSDVVVTVKAELSWGKVGPVTVSGSSRVTREAGVEAGS